MSAAAAGCSRCSAPLAAGIAALVLTVTALIVVRGQHRHVGSAEAEIPGAGGAAAARVLRDSLGMCRVTLPPGWQAAKSGVIWAYGPAGSSAEILLGAGAGSWDEDKATVRNLFAGAVVKVLRDDAGALVLEIEPDRRRSYSVVSVRPGKAGYCWVQLHGSSPGAPAYRPADFATIGASVESLQ